MTNNDIKEIKSLSQSKFRQKYNKFVAEGHKSCIELLKQSKIKIHAVYHLENWTQHTDSVTVDTEFFQVDRKTMSRLSQLSNPPEVLLIGDIKRVLYDPSSPLSGYALYLDCIQDPGNVGTILRIADWYGIHTVIRNEGTADWYHPKVVQASMGSISALNLLEDFEKSIHLNKHTTYGAFLDGKHIQSIEWDKTGILVIGNEGKGISKEMEETIDQKIYIPGSPCRTAESLNVGVATGILCQSIFSALRT